MPNTNRVVIIHNHIFKNAGTTIDGALARELGPAFIDHRDDEGMMQGARYLGRYLLENAGISALSTHHLFLPLPEIPGMRLLLITMFRHPLERVTSVYAFERLQVSSQNPGPAKARESNLREYVTWRLDPLVNPTIRNFHVLKCLPLRYGKPDMPDADDETQALNFARAIDMLGLVERFDESMVLFEETLRAHFPGIDLSYIPLNVGQSAEESCAERLLRLRETLGEAVFNRLETTNAPDLRLHAATVEEFEQRFAALPQADARLEEFRARCKRRQNNEIKG